MDAYYDLCENYAGRSAKTVKRQLKRLIEQDPDFFIGGKKKLKSMGNGE